MGRLSKEAKAAKAIEAVKNLIRNATNKFAELNGYNIVKIDKPEPPYAEILKKIAEFESKATINRAQSDLFVMLTAKAFGVDISRKEVEEHKKAGSTAPIKEWPKFACVVSVKNSNGNNYSLNVPLILSYGYAAVREDGSYGNNLAQDTSSIRPATEEEINKITELQFATLTREHLVVV